MRLVFERDYDCVPIHSNRLRLHPIVSWDIDTLALANKTLKDLSFFKQRILFEIYLVEEFYRGLLWKQLLKHSRVKVLLVDWADHSELLLTLDDTEVSFPFLELWLPFKLTPDGDASVSVSD